MTQVIQALQAKEATLCSGADALCAHCPNLQNGVCITEEKVSAYDKALLDLLNLTPGESIPLSRISAQLQGMDLHEVLQSVCKDCEWQSLCQSKA